MERFICFHPNVTLEWNPMEIKIITFQATVHRTRTVDTYSGYSGNGCFRKYFTIKPLSKIQQGDKLTARMFQFVNCKLNFGHITVGEEEPEEGDHLLLSGYFEAGNKKKPGFVLTGIYNFTAPYGRDGIWFDAYEFAEIDRVCKEVYETSMAGDQRFMVWDWINMKYVMRTVESKSQ